MRPALPTSHYSTALLSALALLALLLPRPSFAADWPQWGGRPERNMYCSATGLPDHFLPQGNGDIKMKPGTEDVDTTGVRNLKWVAKLGSQSYGNVTVAGGRVFIGTNNDPPRDPRYQGDRSVLLCLDEKTGQLLWHLVVPKLASGKVNDWENLGILSSPTVENNRVYLVSNRGEVLCLDAAGMANGNDGPYKDEAKYVVQDVLVDRGKPTERPAPPLPPGPQDADIIWRYDMIDELGVFPHNASDCAPLIVGDLVYVCTSNGQDWTHSNVPSPNAPSLIALDKRTGEFLAEDDAHVGPRIFHGLWCSPTSGNVNGRQLVIWGGGDGFVYAFDPKPVKEGDSTYLKTVWKYDCNPPERKVNDAAHKYPAADGPSEVNATPVFWKNRVYAVVGQDPEHGEGIGNLSCIDATKTGDITQSGKIWNYDKIHRSLSTPSITPDGLLFVGDFSGYLYCFDADTGKLYWTHDMKAHMWGSTMVADGKVYVGDEDGDFDVFAASKEKKLLSTTNLGAPVYGTAVVANGVIYVQTTTHLFAFYDADKAVASTQRP